MDDFFKIYTDRLYSGDNEKIQVEANPQFLAVKDKDIIFPDTVFIQGEAYFAENQLIIRLTLKTKVSLPCLMCNEWVTTSLEVDDFYHVESLENIRDGFFDFSENVREALLIQAPKYIECHQGVCPTRNIYGKFLKQPESKTFPFSNLDK